MYEMVVLDANVFVLANKVNRLTSSSYGHCIQLYANGLYNCHGFSGLCKLLYKEITISFGMGNDFSIPHQCD